MDNSSAAGGELTVHDSALVVSDTPITIQTSGDQWHYACWFDQGDQVSPGARINAIELRVVRGAVSVGTLLPDDTFTFESSPLTPSRRSYEVRIPASALVGASRVMIRNVARDGPSIFELRRWETAAAGDQAGRHVVPDPAGLAAIGFSGTVPWPQVAADPDRPLALRALSAALDQAYPDLLQIRSARQTCDDLLARHPGAGCAVVLPFDAAAGAEGHLVWLTGHSVARRMFSGLLAGDAIAAALAEDAAVRNRSLDLVVIHDEALATALLLSPNDLRSLSRVVSRGVVLVAAVDDWLVGVPHVSRGDGAATIAGDYARTILHGIGFFDVAVVTHLQDGRLDFDHAIVSRAHLKGFARLAGAEEAAELPVRIVLPKPVLVAMHRPIVAAVEL